MSKTYIYLTVIITVVIGLSAVGLINGGSYELLKGIGVVSNSTSGGTNYTTFTDNNGAGFGVSPIFNSILGAAGLLAIVALTGGIVVGYITNRDWVSAIRVGVAFGFGAWMSTDFWAIYQKVNSLVGVEFIWMAFAIKALLIILYLGFIYSIFQLAVGDTS